MIEMNIEILGLCETRWQGNFNSNEFRVVTSGNDSQEQRGVAIILKKKWTNNIVNTLYVRDRILLTKIKTQTNSIIILFNKFIFQHQVALKKN